MLKGWVRGRAGWKRRRVKDWKRGREGWVRGSKGRQGMMGEEEDQEKENRMGKRNGGRHGR